jgi:hypothetical protein
MKHEHAWKNFEEVKPDEPVVVSANPYAWKDPKTITMRDWLYGRRYLREFVIETIAPGGIGKTTLITVEALSMVSSKALLGIAPPRPLRVWLWNLEDPIEETQRKIQAAALQYGLTAEDIGDRLFVNSGRDTPLVIAHTTRDGATIAQPVVDALVEETKKRQIDVMIVDPFVSCHQVPENDNGAQDMVIKEWGRIAGLGKCATHLVDHARKMAPGEEVTTQSSRGGKAKTDGCRGVWVVNPMTEQEGEKAGVENHRLHFRIYDDKPNLHPPTDKRADWYKLVSVDLPNGHLGGPGDSVGVVTKWEWPDFLAGITGRDFDKAAAAIRAGRWKESIQAKDWVGRPIAKALGLDLDSKIGKAKTKELIKVWIKAGSLVVVEEKDDHREIKKFVKVADDG